MKKLLYSIFLLAFVSCLATEGWACTSAVISGKVTPDGRPLLWKHRDTDFIENGVLYFSEGRYPFIGIVNSADPHPTEVWMGTNSKGFSLMNTQSYNLVQVKEGEERGIANGRVIRQALAVCATVDDFRLFLDTLSKPSQLEANFGVIDAQGGAAMFEVDDYKYTMFDANNAKDAPCGYIARTNFSFTGDVNQGAGYVRYMLEDKLLLPAAAMNLLTPQWIFNELSRSFVNPVLGIDLRSGDFNRPKTTGWFVEQDFIPRQETGSAVVVQGVKKGENPELTTMWTVLGYPPVSVAVPVWVKGAAAKLPQLLLPDAVGKNQSALGKKVLALTQKVFSYHQGMGTSRYLNWELLFDANKSGYMQRLAPVEAHVFSCTQPYQEAWRAKGKVDTQQLYQLYDELDRYVKDAYWQLFGL
ncbi:MAG: carcinine hydrolase/isopenicillin-N N-acyltransferase family protein [Bacteroides sp.]